MQSKSHIFFFIAWLLSVIGFAGDRPEGEPRAGRVLGTRCDGTGDDSLAINAALDRAVGRHGGVVQLPAGKCVVASSILIPENVPVVLAGQGVGVTTLLLARRGNRSVVTHRMFSKLSGSGSGGGVFSSTLRDLTIDGNKSEQSAQAPCMALYGHSLTLSNLVVQNCRGEGIVSEWGIDTDFRTPEADLESFFTNIKTMFNDSDGFVFRGPHDSHVTNLISYRNRGWGMVTESTPANSGSLRVAKVNTFLNGLGGIKAGAGMVGEDVAGTTAAGWGMLIDRAAGSIHLVSSTFSGPVALEIRNTNNMIEASVVNATHSGVFMNGGGSSTLVLSFFNNACALLRFNRSSGPNFIVGTGTAATTASSLVEGEPNPGDTISLRMTGIVQKEFTRMVASDVNPASTTFVRLGNALGAGPRMRWCVDCKVASPCVSGGDGAWAFYSSTLWKCPF